MRDYNERVLVVILQAIYLMVGENNPEEKSTSPDSRAQAIFDRMDLNKDGVLTKDEFVKGCLSDEQLYRLLACTDGG